MNNAKGSAMQEYSTQSTAPYASRYAIKLDRTNPSLVTINTSARGNTGSPKALVMVILFVIATLLGFFSFLIFGVLRVDIFKNPDLSVLIPVAVLFVVICSAFTILFIKSYKAVGSTTEGQITIQKGDASRRIYTDGTLLQEFPKTCTLPSGGLLVLDAQSVFSPKRRTGYVSWTQDQLEDNTGFSIFESYRYRWFWIPCEELQGLNAKILSTNAPEIIKKSQLYTKLASFVREQQKKLHHMPELPFGAYSAPIPAASFTSSLPLPPGAILIGHHVDPGFSAISAALMADVIDTPLLITAGREHYVFAPQEYQKGLTSNNLLRPELLVNPDKKPNTIMIHKQNGVIHLSTKNKGPGFSYALFGIVSTMILTISLMINPILSIFVAVFFLIIATLLFGAKKTITLTPDEIRLSWNLGLIKSGVQKIPLQSICFVHSYGPDVILNGKDGYLVASLSPNAETGRWLSSYILHYLQQNQHHAS